MLSMQYRSIKKEVKLLTLAFVAASLTFAFSNQVNAQGFAPPAPPPIGDGSTPAPVIPGDGGAPPAVTTGQADPTPGHNFPTGIGRDRTRVQIFNSNARGRRMVQTIRPDQLSNDELSRIEGVLGASLRTGEEVIDVDVNDAQLVQINDILSPQVDGENPDPSFQPGGQNYNQSRFTWVASQHPLPTVPRFARYLVILGVVCSTIFMAMATWSMVMGNPYGASRVIGAAAGLMLLLSGYTIWKIVQMNSSPSGNSSGPATINYGATSAQVGTSNPASTPGTPGGATSTGRSGFPVQPFRNAQN